MLLKLTIYKAELYKCKYIIELFKLLNTIIELFKYMSHSKLFTCKLATECGQELGEIKYF